MKTNSKLLSDAEVGIIMRLAKYYDNDIVNKKGRKL